MIRMIISRLFQSLVTLFLIVTFSFFMMRIAPGGPFDSERNLPPEIEANIMAKYRLDLPIMSQYVYYMSDVSKGDLGLSFRYQDYTVNELIFEGAKVSFTLGAFALLFALIVGVPFGIIGARREESVLDHMIVATTVFGISIPNFVLGPLLVMLFAILLPVFPAGGLDSARSYFLPVLTLSIFYMAYITRLTRVGFIGIGKREFILTAKAKGLSGPVIVFRHMFRGGILPLVSYLGPAAAGILTGSIVIEKIFQIPGIGQHFVQGALNRDYTLVMGVVVFYSALIITFNFIIDLVYLALDPQVKYR
ncbi:MAG: ABC transporter permease subunit [Acidobacteriota bacterium]|jgi:oligopeptide transport system permease protein